MYRKNIFFCLFLITTIRLVAQDRMQYQVECAPLIGHWIHNLGSENDNESNELGYAMSHYTPGVRMAVQVAYTFPVTNRDLSIFAEPYLTFWFEDELRAKDDRVFNRNKIPISNGLLLIYGIEGGVTYPLIQQAKYELHPFLQFGIFNTTTSYENKRDLALGQSYRLGLKNVFFIKKRKVSLNLAMWTGRIDENSGNFNDYHQINLSEIGWSFYF